MLLAEKRRFRTSTGTIKLLLLSVIICVGTSAKTCKNPKKCRRLNREDLMKDVTILQMKNRIKQQILTGLGLPVDPTVSPTRSALGLHDVKDRKEGPTFAEKSSNFTITSTKIKPNVTELLIVSERPDNFTDKNIIKFQPQFVFHNNSQSTYEKMVVNRAVLLIRVKRKRLSRSNRIAAAKTKKSEQGTTTPKTRRRRRRRSEVLSLTVSTVDESGKPDQIIAMVKSKIGKSRWFNVSIPTSLIQSMLDQSQASLFLHIKCRRCRKNAEMILVHGARRRRRQTKQGGRRKSGRSRRRRKSKLNKSRPILVILTVMEPNDRVKRSTVNNNVHGVSNGGRERLNHIFREIRHGRQPVNDELAPECSPLTLSSKQCCIERFYFNFTESEMNDWVIAPRGFFTANCVGQCPTYTHNNLLDMPTQRPCCKPFESRDLALLTLNNDNNIHYRTIPDIIVTGCKCQN